MTGVRQRDYASQRPGAMSTGQLAAVAASAVVGGKTAFRFGRVDVGKQGNRNDSRSIHGKISRRPGNKAAETVQSNRGKNLSAGGRSSPAAWFRWSCRETQSGTLSRKGFQESASLLAVSKCPSSKSLPTL